MKMFEVIETIETITAYYPFTFKIENLERTAKAWHLFLQDSDYTTVMKNLSTHVKTERFPPTIADLLKIPVVDKYENGRRAIPNVEETRLMLEASENRIVATPEERKKELAKTAMLLGIIKPTGESNE